jgi:hypothetical protein
MYLEPRTSSSTSNLMMFLVFESVRATFEVHGKLTKKLLGKIPLASAPLCHDAISAGPSLLYTPFIAGGNNVCSKVRYKFNNIIP